MKSSDEPLFVLRYQQRKVIPLAVLWLLAFGPLGTYCLFAHVPRCTFDLIFARSFGFLSLLVCGAAVTEMLLFKEIRLYRDRIVKEWRLAGSRELSLTEVGLISQSWPTLGIGARSFFKQGMSPLWRWLMSFAHSIGMTYKEHFADPKKVEQLNTLLAELSGRTVDELVQTITIERFINTDK